MPLPNNKYPVLRETQKRIRQLKRFHVLVCSDCVKENPGRRVTFFFLYSHDSFRWSDHASFQQLTSCLTTGAEASGGQVPFAHHWSNRGRQWWWSQHWRKFREKNAYFRDGGPVIIMGTYSVIIHAKHWKLDSWGERGANLGEHFFLGRC